MPPYRPRKSAPSKPFRKRPQLPLDPSHLVQRPLDAPTGTVPRVQLKSPTLHPTVFRKRIANVPEGLTHGDLVHVIADDKSPIGFGFWNPRAEAQVRIIRWGDVPPNLDWWKASLERAISLRMDMLHLQDATEAIRLINAEGDGFPGLMVDQYSNLLSVEAFTLAMYQRSCAIAELMSEISGIPHWVVRPGPSTAEQEGFLADSMQSGNVPPKVKFREHDVRFEVKPFEGHKTGFFCDQRDNRVRLRQFCAGKDVLDLCCYAGGFALNAAHAKAKSVTAVDLDEEAIAFAKRNSNLNGANIKFVHADAFSYMRDMQRNGKSYDVVILDPPKLIRNRDEAHEGQNKYFDFNELAGSLVRANGMLLTCSCSGLFSLDEFTRTVRAALADREPRILMRTGPGADHPVSMGCLEGDYLKCLWLQLNSAKSTMSKSADR